MVAAAQADPVQKLFSDWQLTCNNAAHCVARSIPGDQGLVMTLSRSAGSDDKPLLRIDYGSAYSGALPLRNSTQSTCSCSPIAVSKRTTGSTGGVGRSVRMKARSWLMPPS